MQKLFLILISTIVISYLHAQVIVPEHDNIISNRTGDFIVDYESFRTNCDSLSTRSVSSYQWNWNKVERFPHIGNPRIPIILIEYADYPLTFNKINDWEEWFNGTKIQDDNINSNHSSVAEYFNYCSGGKFRPVFDIYGPYNLKDYFGKDINGNDSISAFRTQYRNGQETDLVQIAIKIADKDIDYQRYRTVHETHCDLVFVLAAGPSHAMTQNYEDLHPKCGIYYYSGTYDNTKIVNWGLINELEFINNEKCQDGIGVMVHELSHALGLTDLYPYINKADYNNDEPEAWDIMDDGENLYNRRWPMPYTAWERDIMSWIEPDTLSESRQITLYPLSDSRGKACKFINPYNEKEWWLIENIPAGITVDEQGNTTENHWYKWIKDYCDGNNGLLIMHMDNNNSGNGFGYLSLSAENKPNDECSALGGHPRCTVLPADNLLVSLFNYMYDIDTTLPDGNVVKTTPKLYFDSYKGDLYPGISNVTSLAKFKNYYGNADSSGSVIDLTEEGYGIRNIKLNDDGSVTFNFYYGDMPTSLKEVKNENMHHNYVNDAYYITNDIFVKDGKLYIIKK